MQDKFRDILKNSIRRYPESVYFFINENCNYRCLFCHFHSGWFSGGRNDSIDFPFEIFKRIIDELSALKVKYVSITGNGEPTLHPEVAGMIDYAKQRDMFLRICTNAAFNSELADKIFLCDEILINLCAADKGLYNLIHQPCNPDQFEVVLENIKILKSLGKNMKKHKPKFTMKVVLVDYNCDNLEDIFEFAQREDFDRIDFTVCVPNSGQSNLVLSSANIKKMKDAFSKLSDSYSIETNLPKISSYLYNYKESVFNLKSCYAGWFNLLIFPDANVSFCRATPIIGNVSRDSIKDIWFSKKAHLARLKLKYNLTKLRTFFCDYCRFAETNHEIELLS